MKKIGILNFQYSTHNYGAVLQAAALEHICRQFGHDAKHLDYMARPKMSLKSRIGLTLRKMGLRKTPNAKLIANEEAFERFRRNFITRTPRINSYKDFTCFSKNYEVVIVGSDQVWRPTISKDTLAFFLSYVPQGIDRIAYAASFGTENWEKKDDTVLTTKVQKELLLFKAISCREKSGVEICKSVFGVEASHVLDPLLLADESFFEKVVSKSFVKAGAKIVFYKLDSTPDFYSDLGTLGVELGSDAVNIYHKDSHICEYREVADWLALILASEVVVTDSFHGICLALRFGKDVIFCPNEKRGQTRLDSLFDLLNIEAVPLSLELKTPMFKLVTRVGDIKAILATEQVHSRKFLEDSLRD